MIESTTLSEGETAVGALGGLRWRTPSARHRRGTRGTRNALHRGEAVLVLLLFCVLAAAWFWHTWAAPTTHSAGAGADSYAEIWSMAWIPYALGHGLNPLVTQYVNAPQGVNLMWTPMMPLPSLLVSPITVTAGPVVAYNVIATAAPALAAWAAYLAIRRWTGPFPALVGALVFAFSPFVAAQSADHVFLTFSMSAPLLLIVLDRLLVVQEAPAWQDGVFLGLLFWAQLLISEEILAIEVVVAAVAVVVTALLNVHEIRAKLEHAAKGLAVAAGVAAILSAWPLAVQFFGQAQAGSAALYSQTFYSTDLWNFISPTTVTALHTSSAISLERHFTANPTEWGSYLGIPLIVSLVGSLVICRRRRVAWVGVTIVVSTALLTLGPSLHIAGHDTGIPLPWTLLTHLPVLRDLLPVRAAGIMYLGAGLLLALGLEEVGRRALTWRATGCGLAALSLAVLAPTMPYFTNSLPTDASLAAGLACPTRPRDNIYLFPAVEYSALWQAQAGFCFAMPAKNAFHAPPRHPWVLDYASTDASSGYAMPNITPSLRARTSREFRELKLTALVLPVSTPPPASPTTSARLTRWLTELLGVPPRHMGDLLIWAHPRVAPAR